MRLSPEAVLDHFCSIGTAAPAAGSNLGRQLAQAKQHAFDSRGRRVRVARGATRATIRDAARNEVEGSFADAPPSTRWRHRAPRPTKVAVLREDVLLEGKMAVRNDARPDPTVVAGLQHDAFIAAAEAGAIARSFRALAVIPCDGLDTLRAYAARTRRRQGDVAANVIAAYQRWVQTDAHGSRSPTNEALDAAHEHRWETEGWMSWHEARERKVRDMHLERKALDCVLCWLDDDTLTDVDARAIYVDALRGLRAWCDREIAPEGRQHVWMRASEAATRAAMPLRTLQFQCGKGELPARKRAGEWWIDLTACANACSVDNEVVDLLSRRMADDSLRPSATV